MRVKTAVGCIGLCVVAFSSSEVFAAPVCKANGYYVNSNYDLRFSSTALNTVTVPLNQVVGGVIGTPLVISTPELGTTEAALAPFVPYVNCPEGTIESFEMTGNPVVGMAHTYHTNVDNIGYRAYYPGSSSVGERTNTALASTHGSALYFPQGEAKIEFVLLSADWSGNRLVASGNVLASSKLTNAAVDSSNLLRYSLQSGITFVPAPCQFVSDQNMNVTLDSVYSLSLATVGAAVSSKQFSMHMQCAPTDTPPIITFRGVGDSSGLQGVIKNDPSLAAGAQNASVLLEYLAPGSGVSSPVNLSGTDMTNILTNMGSCGANCNEWKLDLQASYIRTSSNPVVAGNIVARAEVTVQYP